jgi:hypothetical protein
MRKLNLATVIIALTAFVAVGGMAVTPAAVAAPSQASKATDLSAVQSDIAKLVADVNAKHDLVVADAAKVVRDAKALQSSDKQVTTATLKADLLKLESDWHELLKASEADRQQLRKDAVAAYQDPAQRDQLRQILTQAAQQLNAVNQSLRDAVQQASEAVQSLRHSQPHQDGSGGKSGGKSSGDSGGQSDKSHQPHQGEHHGEHQGDEQKGASAGSDHGDSPRR